jgi:hypothetical protein
MDSQKGITFEDVLTKDILELLGMQNLPENEKEELRKTMYETVQNRIAARVLDGLDKEEAKHWQQLLMDNKLKEMNDFLLLKGIDIDQIAAEETLFYKTQLAAQAEIAYSKVK